MCSLGSRSITGLERVRCRISYKGGTDGAVWKSEKETRKSRYQLAQAHIGALLIVKKYGNREQKKDEFWETYGTMEIIDIFLGDDD